MSVKQPKRKKKKTKSSKVKNSVKIPSGWNTTDEEEIKRRILRAETEPMTVTNLEPEIPYFSTYTVQSKTAQSYFVEIRSLSNPINSCSCTDYEINGLGTCKHIEKVLLTLRKKGKRLFKEADRAESLRTEIYMDPTDHQVKLAWAQETNNESIPLLSSFFSANGSLIADAKTTIPVLVRLLSKAPEQIQKCIRLSNRLTSLADLNHFTQKMAAKDFFLQDVSEEKYTLDIAKMPLYEYQKQGMLHLAFLEKAILAYEMGLGKTVQAIVAADLLRKLKGIRKVLVIAPTSLKAEWEEQIAKFTNHPSLIVSGNRAERLRHYQKEAFFYLTNYEQVVRDREDIQRLIAPDIVILDEAQRIKNWKTKTAATLKQLQSPYAFVLTGTPLENRIDDIYSIVQFLYPKLFGSLFRFNREFYQLDDKGKPIGYKNLHLLHERLKPILLRRLKGDVEDQLPNRTINTYFVPMSDEQRSRYGEYEDMVARLAAIANKRPLEFKKLQMALASMRMVCDTPYILDENSRICPKLHELEHILEELFQDNQTKIIIFSEWERMLQLVKELLTKMNIGYAWHTGSVNQLQRRKEINRFKEETACKVFLSTDSGAVGLNLQVANVVINLDLPWNPAKLEQRIARAWRKHQAKTVQVINLVSEDTIEHRMLGVLDLKKRLADSILDLGTLQEMEIPSGRKAFMEQLGKILGSSGSTSQYIKEEKQNTDKEPLLLFQQEVIARFKPRLHEL
jgi:SNF2 family DNA or RNA helicase